MLAQRFNPAQALLARIADEELRRQKLADSTAVTVSEIEAAAVHQRIVGHIDVLDWKRPDYQAIEDHRAAALERIRKEPKCLPALKLHYKLNPDDFIDDWGYTYDPRNIEVNLPAKVPFKLFPMQREFLRKVMQKWRAREPLLVEKSRDCGLSWLAVSLGCTLCLYYSGMNLIYGSRKEEYVDKKGAPKSLFYKARKFMEYLPPEFNGGWDERKDAPSMSLRFRATESTMTGEAGDNIGRGDRGSIAFVDEAAYLENPRSVDAALSQTTNCQIDISSVHGMSNTFAEKRHAGKVEVFIFDWRDDPRKDDAWYAKQEADLDEIIVAQEIDRNYQASVEGVVIPSAWVTAAIDAHEKLGVEPTGRRSGALDVADEGPDLNAFCGAHGILVEYIDEWSGKGSDIFATTERAFDICDEEGYEEFKFDSDGLGAGVKGDARVLNTKRPGRAIAVYPFRGSEGVFKPEGEDVKGRKNKDYFANRKAQAWWSLRQRFKITYQAVKQGKPFKPDEIISISSKIPGKLRNRLVTELSQPTYETNNVGKIVIDKMPNGVKSPNLADSVMIKFSSISAPLNLSAEVIAKSAKRPGPAFGSVGLMGNMGRARGSRVR